MEHEYTGNEQQGHHKHWNWTNLEWNCLEQIRIKPMLMSKEKKLSFCEGGETGWQDKPWFQDCHLCRTSTCRHCWCHQPWQSHHSWWEPSLHAVSHLLLLEGLWSGLILRCRPAYNLLWLFQTSSCLHRPALGELPPPPRGLPAPTLVALAAGPGILNQNSVFSEIIGLIVT